MRSCKSLAKWRSGEPVLGTTLHLADQSIFEMVSLMGFDLLWVDLEHHAHSLETVSGLMRAARVGSADVIARPAKGEFMRLARLLESGAQGIMYPRCTTAEEAAEVVRNAKFPPMGDRGLDGAGPDMPYGLMDLHAYLKWANEETFIAIQIEDKAGLDQAEAIARTAGVDLLFFGPGDYSIRNGFAGNFNDDRYWEAIGKVAKAAKSAGKWWGTPAFDALHAQKLLDAGAMLITRSSDLSLLRQAYDGMKSEFGALGFTFDSFLY
ncbi:hypothetical protein JHJ32_15475 [Parapedobacter sp. ISTM3]|uniref:HpcH/HpaI aldolase family protein n=1 Tax=Parapedobacter sp. ISTM3 TaxID=2800130 RepID=UPI0019069AD2|nr:aldolase/citrate lyase family protein [Parapedobacter sp. ISTM3]MBK1441400.1 hypothetical protein [Parapedobacter sp. ISTM3]